MQKTRREELQANKDDLAKALHGSAEIMQNQDSSNQRKVTAVYNIHTAVTNHFNRLESMISEDELSGANNNPRWRTFLAETAHDALETYLLTFDLIQEWSATVGLMVANFVQARMLLHPRSVSLQKFYPKVLRN